MKHVITTSKETLKNLEPGPEKEALKETIDDIEKRWNELHTKVVKRESAIKKLQPLSEHFNAEVEKLLPWLLTADKEIRIIQPLSSQPELLVQQKRAIEVRWFFITSMKIYVMKKSSLLF